MIFYEHIIVEGYNIIKFVIFVNNVDHYWEG